MASHDRDIHTCITTQKIKKSPMCVLYILTTNNLLEYLYKGGSIITILEHTTTSTIVVPLEEENSKDIIFCSMHLPTSTRVPMNLVSTAACTN